MSWIESLSQKLSDLSEADFEYIETNDINDASKLADEEPETVEFDIEC